MHKINQCHSILKWASRKTKFRHNSCIESMETIYQTTEEILKGDPYIGVWNQALETVEHLCLITDYCKTNAFNLASHQQSKHWAWIETKEMGTNWRSMSKHVMNSWSVYKRWILRWGNWSIFNEGQFCIKFYQEIHGISQNSKKTNNQSFLWTLT